MSVPSSRAGGRSQQEAGPLIKRSCDQRSSIERPRGGGGARIPRPPRQSRVYMQSVVRCTARCTFRMQTAAARRESDVADRTAMSPRCTASPGGRPSSATSVRVRHWYIRTCVTDRRIRAGLFIPPHLRNWSVHDQRGYYDPADMIDHIFKPYAKCNQRGARRLPPAAARLRRFPPLDRGAVYRRFSVGLMRVISAASSSCQSRRCRRLGVPRRAAAAAADRSGSCGPPVPPSGDWRPHAAAAAALVPA